MIGEASSLVWKQIKALGSYPVPKEDGRTR
jgi:hypothetical protein